MVTVLETDALPALLAALEEHAAPWTVMGAGLLLSITTATVPLLLGHDVLEASVVDADLPVLGTVKATSSLLFDIGVYVLVVGLVRMVFEAFGDPPPPPVEGDA